MAFSYSGYNYPQARYYLNYYGGPYFTPQPRQDDEIRSEVIEILEADSWVDSTKVLVRVKGGVVTLEGTVDSVAAKRSAGDDAWDVEGVSDVNNELVIEG